MVDLTDYLWIAWLVFILVCVIIELLTLDFTFLMIAVGSVAGLATSFTPLAFWVQVVIVAIVSVLLIFAVRPPLIRRLHRGEDPALSNVAALLGQPAVVVTDFVSGNGYVKLSNGETWTARLSGPAAASARTLDTGDRVVVVTIDGATAVVEPDERKPL